MGESFYNPLLPVVVDELDAKGLLVEDDGALCVFPPGFENRNGEPLPLIVRKSDGGYGYPATDLACVRDRTGRIGATRLVYVVGAEQSLHLRLVFAVAALAGYLPDASAAVHVRVRPGARDRRQEAGQPQRWLRAAGRPLVGGDRAGRGGAEGALERPVARGAGRHGARPGHRRGQVRRPVHGAHPGLHVRLGPDARVRGQHGAVPAVRPRAHPLHLPPRRGGAAAARYAAPSRRAPERALALQLLRFGEAVEATAETYSPSKLATYLFDLATAFTTFYEACRVLVDDEAVRTSRLALSDLTARVLEQGLALLGMEAPEQM